MKNKRFSKFISLMLASTMLVTSVPATTIASETDQDLLLIDDADAEESPAVEEVPQADDSEFVLDEPEVVSDENAPIVEEEDPVSDDSAPADDLGLIVEDDMEDADFEESGAAYPAVSFTENPNDDLIVTVTAEEGILPEGTEMTATPVQLTDVQNVIDHTADVDGTVVEAVDITFYNNGEEIQPMGDVSVKITTAKLDEVQEAAVVHLDTTAEVLPTLDAEAVVAEAVESVDESSDTVAFEADEFSVYAIVDVDIDVIAGTYQNEANGLLVTVNTEDGTFDEPVTLTVDSIAAESAAYQTAEAELAGIDQEYEGMVAYDIHFVSQKSGEKVEPNKSVDVKIQVTDAEAAGVPEEAVDQLTITHIFDEGGAEVVAEPEKKAEEPIPDSALPKLDGAGDEYLFGTDTFSTYTISWRDGYYSSYSYNINYVDENGNSLTPTMTPTYDNDYMYLVYDIPGYEFDSCHLRSRYGTSISPILAKYTDWGNNDRLYYNNNKWDYLRDNIYVVYKKKATPTVGGTAKPTGTPEWPTGDGAPKFGKSSTSNKDNTNTVSLTIEAAEKQIESSSKANVIVVFDVSGSMRYDMAGRQEYNSASTAQYINSNARLSIAAKAVNSMAKTLLAKKDSKGNSLVKMGLVSFSTNAAVVQGFTNNYSTFSSQVNNLKCGGGTNWEQALQTANTMAVDSDAATFVVFVTDGNPSLRLTRYNVSDKDLEYDIYPDFYVSGNGVFGQVNSDRYNRNFDAAVEQVKSIVANNKTFFSIGVSSDVTNVTKVTVQGGGKAENSYTAADEASLAKAFDSVTSSISGMAGFGDVQIKDGITALSNTKMEVMEEVDPNSFKYWITENGQRREWTTREADGCGAASYNKETGTVEWNMGSGFQLKNGATYEVTFKVWPSEEAFNLVADLNNGLTTYESLTAAQKEQIVKNADGTYSLKTNTSEVEATYKKTTKSGDTVTVSDTKEIEATFTPGTIENMPLTAMLMTVKKVFLDTLTGGEDREASVTLEVQRRAAGTDAEFEAFTLPKQSDNKIVLNAANNWEYSFYVAPGLKDNDGDVLVNGYEYTLTEPGIDYHYDLNGEIISPMIIAGKQTFVGDGKIDQNGDGVIEDVEVASVKDTYLTAQNAVKGGITVKKVLVNAAGKELQTEDAFTIKGSILDPKGQPYTWADGDDINASGTYKIYKADGTTDGKKYHFASTANIELTLKAGEYVRFINIPKGSTYEFYEDKTSMPEGIAYQSIKGLSQTRDAKGDYTKTGVTQPKVANDKVSGMVLGNISTDVTVTNKLSKQFFYVYHSSDNSIEKIATDDARVTTTYDSASKKNVYTFSIYAETNNDTLYGGYYKAYGGQKLNDEGIRNLTYTNGKAKDAEGTPYDATKATSWKKANAYTVAGTAMHPEANTVYYLKEVPTGYLRPYIQVMYDKHNDNELVHLYLFTAIDDANYQTAGIATVDSQYRATKTTAVVTLMDSESQIVAKLTAHKVYDGRKYFDGAVTVPRGYLAYSVQDQLIQANSTFNMTPYYVTIDGITMYGRSTRTVHIKETKYYAGENDEGMEPGIWVTDARCTLLSGGSSAGFVKK